eukprot:9322-Heterococcus_DN1.PRE.1
MFILQCYRGRASSYAGHTTYYRSIYSYLLNTLERCNREACLALLPKRVFIASHLTADYTSRADVVTSGSQHSPEAQAYRGPGREPQHSVFTRTHYLPTLIA